MGRQPRFCVQNSRERLSYCLIFPNDAAGNKICVFCRLICSKAEKHILFQVSDNQIDGNQWGIADNVSKIIIGKELGRVHVAADKLGYLIPQLRTLALTLGQHHPASDLPVPAQGQAVPRSIAAR